MASKPTSERAVSSEPDVLPLWRVDIDITVLAKDHEAALAWAADRLEAIFNDEAVIGSGAHVRKEPVEFLDAD